MSTPPTTTYENHSLNTKKKSQWLEVWKRLKKSRTAVIGLILILMFLMLALFAPFIADYETDALGMNVKERLQSPNLTHWFGDR